MSENERYENQLVRKVVQTEKRKPRKETTLAQSRAQKTNWGFFQASGALSNLRNVQNNYCLPDEFRVDLDIAIQALARIDDRRKPKQETE